MINGSPSETSQSTIHSVSIIVPAYNEIRTIETLTRELLQYSRKHRNTEIIIVESGSTDGTREVLQEFEENLCADDLQKLIFVYEGRANGKGSACRLGIDISSKDTIVIFDADLEYSLQDVETLVNFRVMNNAKIVLGSRHRSGQPMRSFSQSKLRSAYFNFGHQAITAYFNLLFGTQLRDPATMWKVVDGEICRSLDLTGSKFDFDWELLAAFIRNGFIPHEINIHYSSRSPNEGKKIRPFKDPVHWIVKIAIYRFRRYP
jgi:glycosyltransferase involved in cell wall biosynthesis